MKTMQRRSPTVGIVPPAMIVFMASLAHLAAPCVARVEAAENVPTMDGAVGPCSLELAVNGPDGKPVYAAIIKVHIAYGFGGIRKLDLEAGSNSDGKVKFTGLPAAVHRPPLEFRAVKDDLEGVTSYDPAEECQGKHRITLDKPKNDDAK